ncbi:MAG: hypothetical protein ACKPKO_23065, partial [Candidatus Fonsibacter sp.]
VAAAVAHNLVPFSLTSKFLNISFTLWCVAIRYMFPDGLLVDQSPRVRLYIPVQYLYQLVRSDVVVYQVTRG